MGVAVVVIVAAVVVAGSLAGVGPYCCDDEGVQSVYLEQDDSLPAV